MKKNIKKIAIAFGMVTTLCTGMCATTFASSTGSDILDTLNSLYTQHTENKEETGIDTQSIEDLLKEIQELSEKEKQADIQTDLGTHSDTLEDVLNDNRSLFDAMEKSVNHQLEAEGISVDFDADGNTFYATYIVDEEMDEDMIELYRLMMEYDKDSQEEMLQGVEETLEGLLMMAEDYDIDKDAIVTVFRFEDKVGHQVFEITKQNGQDININQNTEPSGSLNDDEKRVEQADWSEACFMVDGVLYELPCTFQDFEYNGWDFTTAGDEVLDYDETTDLIDITHIDYPDFFAAVSMYNDTKGEKNVAECPVYEFACTVLGSESSIPDILLPGGLTWGSTQEEVEAQYGEADDIMEEADDYIFMNYFLDNGQYMSISIENGGLTGFYMSNPSEF